MPARHSRSSPGNSARTPAAPRAATGAGTSAPTCATEFSDVALQSQEGRGHQPIITQDGCFLLYVEDRKYAGIQPLDEVRDEIERILAQQMTRQSQEHWLERLRRNGYVKMF